MKILELFKKINDFSIIFAPGPSIVHIYSKTVKGWIFFFLLTIFTFFIVGFTAAIIVLTPVKEVLIDYKGGLTESERKLIHDLNIKVNFLINEIDNLEQKNKKLKEIISNTRDTVSSIEAPAPKGKKRRVSGDVFSVLKEVINKYFFGLTDFISPVTGYISKEFLPKEGHYGVDFTLKEGTPILASANGYVVFSDFTINNGYMVIIAHKEDYITVYKHCSSVVKRERDKVYQGEIIAYSGNTGRYSYGPHLHFEVWYKGKVIDPKTVINNL